MVDEMVENFKANLFGTHKRPTERTLMLGLATTIPNVQSLHFEIVSNFFNSKNHKQKSIFYFSERFSCYFVVKISVPKLN